MAEEFQSTPHAAQGMPPCTNYTCTCLELTILAAYWLDHPKLLLTGFNGF